MKKQLLLLALSLSLFFTGFSQKGVYIKFAGITNTVTGVHANEFLASAFEMTDSNTAVVSSGGGGGSGKSYFGVVKVKKILDPETNPTLMTWAANGRHIQNVTITWYNSSNVAYYQVLLTSATFQKSSILSPQCTGNNCDNLYEELHIDYATIKWINPVTGTAKGWNRLTNSSF